MTDKYIEDVAIILDEMQLSVEMMVEETDEALELLSSSPEYPKSLNIPDLPTTKHQPHRFIFKLHQKTGSVYIWLIQDTNQGIVGKLELRLGKKQHSLSGIFLNRKFYKLFSKRENIQNYVNRFLLAEFGLENAVRLYNARTY